MVFSEHLRVVRCSNEIMIQWLIHILTNISIIRIKDITFRGEKIIGET